MWQQELKNNIRVSENVLRMLNSERSVHAYLFIGGNAASRHEIGYWLSKELLCKDEFSYKKFEHGNEADFILISKPQDRESILKDQILELTEKLNFKPFGDKYVVLVEDGHLMNAAAQNKLLKTLEEPVTEAVIIILAERADAILETVRSRCACFYLEEAESEGNEQLKALAFDYAKLVAQGSQYYKKKAILQPILNDKDDARNSGIMFLDILEEQLIELSVKGNEKCAAAIRQVETARMYLKQVHSVAYTLKQMSLRV